MESSINDFGRYSPVAQNLMAKMGYEAGRGLGKTSQGIVEPVSTSMQRGRRGLGHIPKDWTDQNLNQDTGLGHILDCLKDEKVYDPMYRNLQRPRNDWDLLQEVVKVNEQPEIHHSSSIITMERNNNVLTCEEVEDFLTSEKRLFNRRGSKESEESYSSQSSIRWGSYESNGACSFYYSNVQTMNPNAQEFGLNPNAQEFVPTPQMEMETSPVEKKSKKKTKKANKPSTTRCCTYCFRQGYDAAMYESHSMRKKSKELICPVLLSDLCKTCGDTHNDRDIHKESDCPVRGFQPFIISKFC